jgi:hypothetical protein
VEGASLSCQALAELMMAIVEAGHKADRLAAVIVAEGEAPAAGVRRGAGRDETHHFREDAPAGECRYQSGGKGYER